MSTTALATESSCISVLYAASVRSSAIVSSISAIAWSTAASRAGESPSPRSSTSPGSHATITTLPDQPPTARTNRSTVAGSIPCGLIASPSSIVGAISSRSGSIR